MQHYGEHHGRHVGAAWQDAGSTVAGEGYAGVEGPHAPVFAAGMDAGVTVVEPGHGQVHAPTGLVAPHTHSVPELPVQGSFLASLQEDMYPPYYPMYDMLQEDVYRFAPEFTGAHNPHVPPDPFLDPGHAPVAGRPLVVHGDVSLHAPSKDTNPTPTKRARESDAENTSPGTHKPALPVTSSSAPAPQKRRRGRPPKPKVEADVDALDDVKSAGTDWLDPEVTKLLEALFGTSPIVKFEKFEKDPMKYCKKISKQIFGGTRTAKAIKGKYTRMRTVFMNILTFESWTGGGSDPDLRAPPDWKQLTVDEVEARFEKGRRAGKEYGKLTAGVYKRWQQKGWYDYFSRQLATHPNLIREREHCADVLSEAEQEETVRSSSDVEIAPAPAPGARAKPSTIQDDNLSSSSDSESDSDLEFKLIHRDATPARTPAKAPGRSQLRTPSKTPLKTASKTATTVPVTPLAKQRGVPERRHPGKVSSGSTLATHAGEFMESNSNFLKAMQASNEGQLVLATKQFQAGQARNDRKLDLEERQFEMQQKRLEAELAIQRRQVEVEERRAADAKLEARIQEARRIMSDSTSPAALKDAATSLVLQYLTPTA